MKKNGLMSTGGTHLYFAHLTQVRGVLLRELLPDSKFRKMQINLRGLKNVWSRKTNNGGVAELARAAVSKTV